MPTSLPSGQPRVRNAGVVHRNAITAADLVAAPGNPTMVDRSADGGSLTAGTNYKCGLIAVSLRPGSGAISGGSSVNAATKEG